MKTIRNPNGLRRLAGVLCTLSAVAVAALSAEENVPGVTEGPMSEDAVLAIMEKAVAPETWKGYCQSHPQGFWVFGEARTRPVRRNIKPEHWFDGKTAHDSHLAFVAQPGEWFAIQLCAVSDTARKLKWNVECAKNATARPESIELVSKADNAVAANAVQPLWAMVVVPKDAAGKRLELDAWAADAATGEKHQVRFSLDVKGEVLADGGVKDAWRLARLRWFNSSQLGREPVVTKPYSPITVDAATRTIRLTGKDLVLGENGLPARIVSRYTGSNQSAKGPAFEVLATPFQFKTKGLAQSGDGALAVAPKRALEFTKTAPDEVCWKAVAADGTVVEGKCDYTGSASFRMVPAAGLKEASLTLAMPKEVARYLEGLGHKGEAYQPFLWKWNVKFHQDAFWVGRVNAGLAFRFKDAHFVRPLINCYYKWRQLKLPDSWGKDGTIEFARRESDGAATITATGHGQGEYNFDLYLTPFHPLDLKAHLGDRYHHAPANMPNDKLAAWAKQQVADGCTVFNLHHATLQNPYINYPFNDDCRPYLHAIIKAVHDAGALFKIYYTTRELSQNVPEFFAFRSLGDEVIFRRDERIPGWPVTNRGGIHQWLHDHVGTDILPAWRAVANFKDYYPPKLDLAVITQPETRFDNYYLEGLDFLVKEYGIDGLYIDDTALSADAMKRARKILDRDGKRRLVDNHSWSHHSSLAGGGSSNMVFLELYPFFDRLWRGEGFNPKLPADFWLVEMSGLCFGIGSEILERGGDWAGLTFGMTHRHAYMGKGPTPLWRYFDQVRLGDSEMFGWWDDACPVATSDPEVKATAYRCADGRVVVMLANFSGAQKTVTLTCRENLGFKSTKAQRPEIPGFQTAGTEELQSISLDGYGGMVLELSPDAAKVPNVATAPSPSRPILSVGPGKTYAVPSAAASVAKDGDVVEIAAGTYRGDVCVWNAKNLVIRGAGKDQTVVDAAGKCCQGKGTWIVRGAGCRISGVTFRGAKCRDRNGAGIRLEADGAFTVEQCGFEDNENGVLCGVLPKGELKFLGCTFDRNGHGDGYSHNLYIGKVAKLDFIDCASRRARIGHDLKSRALVTNVENCVFDDGNDGTSSYLLNCPNGGKVKVVGCRFVQAPTASNGTMVSIGEEGAYPGSELQLERCNFDNRRIHGTCREVFCAKGVAHRIQNS